MEIKFRGKSTWDYFTYTLWENSVILRNFVEIIGMFLEVRQKTRSDRFKKNRLASWVPWLRYLGEICHALRSTRNQSLRQKLVVYLGGYSRKHWKGSRETEIEKVKKAIKYVLMKLKSLQTMGFDSAETPENYLAELLNSSGVLSISSKAAISHWMRMDAVTSTPILPDCIS